MERNGWFCCWRASLIKANGFSQTLELLLGLSIVLLLFHVTASPVPAGRQVSSVQRIFKKLLSLFTFHLYNPYSGFFNYSSAP